MSRGRRGPGVYLLVAGPDGTGKSTLVRHLSELGRREFGEVLALHWRPGLLPGLARVAGRAGPDPERPHAHRPYGPAVSLLRLVYYWADQVAGYWWRIRPCARRGGLVIMERGYWDIQVDPRRYRLGCPAWVVRLLGTAVARPDLTVVLGGDPAAIAARKPELPAPEIARQLRRWRQVAPGRLLALDHPPGERELCDLVARRLRNLTAQVGVADA